MNADEVFLTDLDALLASDVVTSGRPLLPDGSRERVEEKLARLLVSRKLLDAHVRALRHRVGPALRHVARLPEELHAAVVQGSPSVLDDLWLAKLALNPVALCALRDDLIELPGDDLPASWWALLEREARDIRINRTTGPSKEERCRRAGARMKPR